MKKVEILYNSSYHCQRTHVNKEQTEEHIFPCIQNINVKNEISCFWYSSTNKNGHFGIPKVIFGRFGKGVFIDDKGEYGMCQDCTAVVDKPENLIRIKEALQSEEFYSIIEMLNFGANGICINRKVISLFKKDFWKEFI